MRAVNPFRFGVGRPPRLGAISIFLCLGCGFASAATLDEYCSEPNKTYWADRVRLTRDARDLIAECRRVNGEDSVAACRQLLREFSLSNQERANYQENIALVCDVRGLQLYRSGDLEATASVQRGAIILRPRAHRYASLARTLKAGGHAEAALDAMDSAIEAAANDTVALSKYLYDRGTLHFKLNQTTDAINDFRLAIEAGLDTIDVHKDLGIALLKGGLPDQAVASFDAALAQNSMDTASLEGRGDAEVALKHFEPAVADYRAASGVQGRNQTVRRKLVMAQQMLDEANRRAAAEAARREEDRLAAEAKNQQEKRLAAEAEAKKREEERRAAEAAQQQEKDRLAAKQEADRRAAEAIARDKERLAAEQAEKDRQRAAADEAAKHERERQAAEAAAQNNKRIDTAETGKGAWSRPPAQTGRSTTKATTEHFEIYRQFYMKFVDRSN